MCVSVNLAPVSHLASSFEIPPPRFTRTSGIQKHFLWNPCWQTFITSSKKYINLSNFSLLKGLQDSFCFYFIFSLRFRLLLKVYSLERTRATKKPTCLFPGWPLEAWVKYDKRQWQLALLQEAFFISTGKTWNINKKIRSDFLAYG